MAKFVLLGDYVIDRNDDDAQPVLFNVLDRITHERYKNSRKYYDIALLRLDRKVIFNQYIRPACLPDSFEVDVRNKAIASGWGRTQYRGQPSQILMKVTLDVFTSNECKEAYRLESRNSQLNKGIIDETQFCAGSYTEKKDTCQVDRFANF